MSAHDSRLLPLNWRSRLCVVDPRGDPPELELAHIVPLIVRARERCTLEVLEESGLVRRRAVVGEGPSRVDLIPGSYVLRTSVAGVERSRRSIELGPGGATLDLD